MKKKSLIYLLGILCFLILSCKPVPVSNTALSFTVSMEKPSTHYYHVEFTSKGILEETLVHEAAHTSLDRTHATAAGWLAAQTADGTFISTYARDHPLRGLRFGGSS